MTYGGGSGLRDRGVPKEPRAPAGRERLCIGESMERDVGPLPLDEEWYLPRDYLAGSEGARLVYRFDFGLPQGMDAVR